MKPLTLPSIHRMFAASLIVLVLAFMGFIAYSTARFNRYLIGDIPNDVSQDVLASINEPAFERAVSNEARRRSMPGAPEHLRNPFTTGRSGGDLKSVQ